ncbi:MAG: glycine cleavage system protein GcvH [bacterium]|nr:glycine cleavage system protein GcvH [bacterium]
MQIPETLKYTKDHEWLRAEADEGVVGITDFAQEALGDVVFVELPAVGTALTPGQAFGVVESNKSVSDLLAPVAGTVVAVNEALRDAPESVNRDPYGEGWMIRLRLADVAQLETLLAAEAYRAHVASEHGS